MKSFSGWQPKSLATRSKYNMSPSHMPWTGGKEKKSLIRLPNCARVVDLVNVSWGSRPHGDRSFPWYTDASQDVSRAPWGSLVPCLTTSCIIYDHELDIAWDARAKLTAMGFPTDQLDLSDIPESKLHDLIGEGMFLPNIASLILAAFLSPSAAWWAGDRA